jgi:FeS assembly SUF system protein
MRSRMRWPRHTSSLRERWGSIMDGKPMERDRLALGPEADADLAPTLPQAVRPVLEGGTPVEGSQLSKEELEQLTADIVAALKTVYDPEIPSDIYELGLIYKIDIADDRHVTVDMTLTAPGCPVAGEMPTWVENAVASVGGVQSCTVNLTFDPPWDQSRMSDEARLALNMF